MKQQFNRLVVILFFLGLSFNVCAEKWQKCEKTYKYRIFFTDKKKSAFKQDKPQAFLSEKAIIRRKKQHIKIDELDLPVNGSYLEYLRSRGIEVLCTSKWNNTALVQYNDTAVLKGLIREPFVKAVKKLWTSPDSVKIMEPVDRKLHVTDSLVQGDNVYGSAYMQISMLNGIRLHEAGFRGEDMTIAVLDGGFYNADILNVLSRTKIIGTHNFVRPGKSVFEEQKHGMNVLSCIGANKPNVLIGTAPEASFWLFVTEDTFSESGAEEDYWAAAAEYADSVGVDIITSSLGYYNYDDRSTSYHYWDLDGKTALISRSASLIASRGMLLLNSAGNNGNDSWKKIIVPGDARDMLTVGAVDTEGTNCNFSSVGNTADGRIKPDVVALGCKAAILATDGTISEASGTSFSAPILCGMAACLWQACPNLRPKDLIRLIQQSGNNSKHPDNIFGYGLPDFWKAYQNSTKK